MSDYLGKDMRKVKKDGGGVGSGEDDDSKALDKIVPLDEADISLMRNYGSGPYAKRIKAVEEKIQGTLKSIHALMGVKVSSFVLFCSETNRFLFLFLSTSTTTKDSDTGLAQHSLWDLVADKQVLTNEQPLLVARCTKIIKPTEKEKAEAVAAAAEGHGRARQGFQPPSQPPAAAGAGAGSSANHGLEDKYMINVRQYAKFVVNLAETVAPTDIEEGMRVGVDRVKYCIKLPLPPRIDPTVSMMQVSVCFVLPFFLSAVMLSAEAAAL